MYFGTNEYNPHSSKPICKMIAECFEDFMLRILVIAALVSIIIGTIN